MLEFKDDFTKEDYIRLRNLVSWNVLDDEQIQNIITNSSYKFSALENGKVVAIVRCITDNAYLYLLCDVMVDPLYQGKGVGKMMILEFINYLKVKINNKYAKLYIMSLKGKEGFYKSLGFSEDYATGLTKIFEVK